MKNSCKYLYHLPHNRYYIINSFNPQNILTGPSLGVQWLRLQASTAGGMGSFPARGTKIQHAMQGDKKTPTNPHSYIFGDIFLDMIMVL